MIIGYVTGHIQYEVKVNGQPLPMSELARMKSPTGFCWGYNGSGPAALAHSILTHLYSTIVADTFYQQFKAGVIAKFPQDVGFELAEVFVREWVAEQIKVSAAKGIDERLIRTAASIKGLSDEKCADLWYALEDHRAGDLNVKEFAILHSMAALFGSDVGRVPVKDWHCTFLDRLGLSAE